MRRLITLASESVEAAAIIFRPKRYLGCFLALALCFSGNSELRAESLGDKPSLSEVGSEHVLNLGKKQQDAIRTYNPEFQPRKQADYLPALVKGYRFSEHQAPFAVIGDFDGDGKKDVVLQGHDKANEILIAVLSSNRNPHVIEIKKSRLVELETEYYGKGDHNEYGLWVYLTFVPKGKINSELEEHPLNLSTDAFELVYFEKASVLYYLSGNKIQQYTTGD